MAEMPNHFVPIQRVNMAHTQLRLAREELPLPEHKRLTVVLAELDTLLLELRSDPGSQMVPLFNLPCPFCGAKHG